ncbi:MAG TPA: non-heme iron oxygenase ferredoxin subunit [Actinomycetota bacterium]|nr:non-heme iron oxygenase ferredoxin subunit [Actinomycetota bacterium]
MAFQQVGPSGDLGEGEVQAYDVGGEEIAVARVGGTLYAFSDICTHRRCNLANGGEIDGTSIECECHGSVFSMETGAVLHAPATEPIATYPVRESQGQIEVDA